MGSWYTEAATTCREGGWTSNDVKHAAAHRARWPRPAEEKREEKDWPTTSASAHAHSATPSKGSHHLSYSGESGQRCDLETVHVPGRKAFVFGLAVKELTLAARCC